MTPCKKELRVFYKKKRAAFFSDEPLTHATFSKKICHHAASLIPQGESTACYIPLPGEVDTKALLDSLIARNIPIALPRLTSQNFLSFHLWTPNSPLEQEAFGIWQPTENSPPITPSFFFVPLLAFGPKGTRLGYGKGYYDKTFAKISKGCNIKTIGLAFSWAFCKTLTSEDHDILLDAVVTEKEILSFSKVQTL